MTHHMMRHFWSELQGKCSMPATHSKKKRIVQATRANQKHQQAQWGNLSKGSQARLRKKNAGGAWIWQYFQAAIYPEGWQMDRVLHPMHVSPLSSVVLRREAPHS